MSEPLVNFLSSLSNGMDLFGRVVFPLIATILGALFTFVFFRPYFARRYGRTFNTVRGKVIHSQMHEGYSNSMEAYMYSAEISYEYIYNNKSYSSAKIFQFMESVGSTEPGESRRLLKKYPEGKTITVFVDPEDAQNAYLEEKPEGIIIGIIGISFLIIGIIFIFYWPF